MCKEISRQRNKDCGERIKGKIKNTQNFQSFVRLFTGDWGRILISSITGMKILPAIK